MTKNNIYQRGGFSLVELLIVIVMIALLTGLLLPNLLGMRERARDSKLKSELRELKTALQVFYGDYQSYPDDNGTGGMRGCGDRFMVCTPGGVFQRDGVVYMQALPEQFFYDQLDDGEGFNIWSTLENKSDEDATASQNKCGITNPATAQDYYECVQ